MSSFSFATNRTRRKSRRPRAAAVRRHVGKPPRRLWPALKPVRSARACSRTADTYAKGAPVCASLQDGESAAGMISVLCLLAACRTPLRWEVPPPQMFHDVQMVGLAGGFSRPCWLPSLAPHHPFPQPHFPSPRSPPSAFCRLSPAWTPAADS